MLDIDFKVETPEGFAEIVVKNDSTDLGIAIWDNEEMIKPTVPEMRFSKLDSIRLAESILKYYEYGSYAPLEAVKPKQELNTTETPKNVTELNTPSHYDNSNGSLYHFAELFDLDTYQFDIIKRIVRCKKKGNFSEDLRKTIDVLKLYELEQGKNNQ
jgi:hypothetical protein